MLMLPLLPSFMWNLVMLMLMPTLWMNDAMPGVICCRSYDMCDMMHDVIESSATPPCRHAEICPVCVCVCGVMGPLIRRIMVLH